MAKAKIPHNELPVYRVTASAFHKAVSRGQRANGNGWMVDVHTKKEYKGMKTYLTRDGKAGMAITKDGNVVSLFSAGAQKNSMGKLIPFAVAHGGKKLDCYGGGLQNMYARYGARATGKTAFNPEYAPDLWQQRDASWKSDPANQPDLVAMTLPKSVNSLVRRYDRGRRVDMASVPYFEDYDDMLRDRDRRISGVGAGINAAFGTRG